MKYQYKIVSGDDKSYFEERVSRLMEEGWELVGGVAVSSYREDYKGNKMYDHYFQAMKKVEVEKD